MYSVNILTEVKGCKCPLKCRDCNICPHEYTCTCPDAMLHNTVCKHAHAVIVSANIPVSQHGLDGEQCANSESIQNMLCSPGPSKENNSISSYQKNIEEILYVIKKKSGICTSISTLSNVVKHLKAAEATLNLKAGCINDDHLLLPKKRIAPNTNLEQQPRFYSTKKKRKTDEGKKLSKPSKEDSDEIKLMFDKVNATVCAKCFKENEDQHSIVDMNITWIQCSNATAGFTSLVSSATSPNLWTHMSINVHYAWHKTI